MSGQSFKPVIHLLFLGGAFICCSSGAFGVSIQKLVPLPQGATLPVTLDRGLDAHHVKVGQPVTASLPQRVPLTDGAYLPKKAKLTGLVVSYDGTTLELRFNTLKLGHESEPIDVELVAVGLAVFLWGLHCKVSKYDLWGTASPRPVPVKLLSQNEQPPQDGSQLNRHRKAISTVQMFVSQSLRPSKRECERVNGHVTDGVGSGPQLIERSHLSRHPPTESLSRRAVVRNPVDMA